jgi:hypothetical protein
MAQPRCHRHDAGEVAVRGVALGPVPGLVLGRVQTGGPLRRSRVALAVRTPQGDEWTPLVASAGQIIMTWDRWSAVLHDAVAQHATDGAHGGGPPVRRPLRPASASD